MKPFQFQKFTINQSKNVFRVGTDAVLLGSLCNLDNAQKILEVGTGCGVISLMIAQRNSEAEILAIDINSEATELSKENFQNSPFSSRLKVINQDFNQFQNLEKFDLIVSNPPYFEKNPSEKDILARQQNTLNFTDLIENSAKLLRENGRFSVILPYEEGKFFEIACLKSGLQLERKVIIFGMKNAKAKRLILEFTFKADQCEVTEFTIEESPRKFTEEYLKLTQNFHVFKK